MTPEIECGKLKITFPRESGGLPGRVSVRESDGRETVLFDRSSWILELELEDGRILHPLAEKENLRVYTENECVHADFINVHFSCGDEIFSDHSLTLRHEFYPDGTAFTNMFFFVRDIHTPGIVRFELVAKPDLSSFSDVRWSFRSRPAAADGTMITAPSERFLKPGPERTFDQSLPLAGFFASREFAPSLYLELFMEGHSTLSNKPSDAETSIRWDGHSPEVRWSFQKGPFPRPLINQLRNQWGWVILPAPEKRHLPPMRMVHYFDNYRRYPSAETIAAAANSGCGVFIMHENWRSDAQNDGVPFDSAAFERLRDALHTAGIRLAVYVRGNEESVVQRHADFFSRLLQYNFDGLYMDYGGPFHRIGAPDESYCGGRILFREHYYVMRALRERIGPDGILYSHTGPSFSAMSMPFMTGYVSGEGERGLLIRGRAEHAFFSMTPVLPGTLWSAAFPEYSSERIVPFIAASGQYPHSPLGEQFLSSSLVHPRIPGINDHAFVPVWKLWSILRNEKDLRVVNDTNSTDCFPRDPETGHALYISRTGNFALLILSNFTARTRNVSTDVAWKKAGFTEKNSEIRLLANGKSVRVHKLPPETELSPYGVAGILLSAPEVGAEALLAEFHRPEPALTPEGKQYLARVAEQRRLREDPPAWKEVGLRIRIPEISPTPYEDSMTLDLYNNDFELGQILPDGSFRGLCRIDRSGAFSGDVCKERRIFAGDESPRIVLNRIPGLHGKCRFALRSTHDGEPFYSFCRVELSSSDAPDAETYELEFLNDIEPDRAYLNFNCRIGG